MLIATLENETTNETLVISPGPEGTSKTASTLDLPLFGIIGAVVIIALALVAIAIRRKIK
jgi:tetrahydromethanopterin S-methyltransferase subunit B